MATEHDPGRSTKLSRKPRPLESMGPVLAWHRHSRLANIKVYFVSLGILAVGFTLISLFRGSGLDMLTAWPVWVVAAIGAYLMSNPFSYQTTSAGADWIT
ncbi:hypothetical protein [Amycolatopsis cihanbeyliensis]|uniref:Uncharacterized protein n=1 Tax=Amycolatopsis cihanbeyliensis TaxID=1128664 RepID=A0A542DII9_AMYCI|nr:hypothetical protein [Amycolatopsis cihanbeyliensis]TQJ02917.1 hypothetical protein FB471_2667 [Amycolatopsis cihanbeyliensis]